MPVKKVLIVEDEAITAIDIKERLEALAYIVADICVSGEDAISKAKKLHPDLILMDIVLKGKMDGIEAARKISNAYHIPIIFLTAFRDDDTLDKVKVSDPYGYLTKPFDTRDLRIAIELALYKHTTAMKILASEQRYRSVMQSASCGIFIHDKDGVISEINTQAEIIFGYDSKDIIGHNLREFLIPEDLPYASVQFQKLLIEKKIGPNEGNIQSRNGKLVDVEFSSVFIESENENFMVTIINDITARNRMRAQTMLNDKLATVGTLAAGIIHEINNPMTWIVNNLAYLKRKITLLKPSASNQPSLVLRLEKIIEESIMGTKRILEIILNLKGFARIDPDNVSAIDIHKTLKTAIKIAQPQYKNITKIETDFAANIPPLLLGNSKLQQVFLNLIVNATHAMAEGNFQNNLLRIKTSMEGTQIRIDISDTGKGIPPDALPKIFEPFFTTKPIGVGTGLGLSICYDIIHNLGGDIHVETALNKGTTFSIYLPIKLTAPASIKSDASTIEFIDRKRILVVDDDPTLLIVIKRLLEKHHDVIVTNGRAALGLLASECEIFDVIISDLNMPDVSGIDLYRYVEKHHNHLAKNMIFITGGTDTPIMEDFRASVKNKFLEKPFTSDQLQQKIQELFSP